MPVLSSRLRICSSSLATSIRRLLRFGCRLRRWLALRLSVVRLIAEVIGGAFGVMMARLPSLFLLLVLAVVVVVAVALFMAVVAVADEAVDVVVVVVADEVVDVVADVTVASAVVVELSCWGFLRERSSAGSNRDDSDNNDAAGDDDDIADLMSSKSIPMDDTIGDMLPSEVPDSGMDLFEDLFVSVDDSEMMPPDDGLSHASLT